MRSDQNDDAATLFVGDTEGPDNLACSFEDDGETGYLYVSDRKLNKIVRHLQVYNNASVINPSKDDISVVWSSDGKKCGVLIFNGRVAHPFTPHRSPVKPGQNSRGAELFLRFMQKRFGF